MPECGNLTPEGSRSGAYCVVAAVDVDHLAGRLWEPVRQQGHAGFGDRLGVVDVPQEEVQFLGAFTG